MQVETLFSIRPIMQHSKANGNHADGKKGKFLTLLQKKYFVPTKTLQYVRSWQYFTVATDIFILFTVMNCSNLCLPSTLHILVLV